MARCSACNQIATLAHTGVNGGGIRWERRSDLNDDDIISAFALGVKFGPGPQGGIKVVAPAAAYVIFHLHAPDAEVRVKAVGNVGAKCIEAEFHAQHLPLQARLAPA